METLREKTVSFCGTVRDSLTMVPMARIPLKFKRNPGDASAFLTADTDSLGGFCLEIPLSNNPDGRAFWSINAPDYYPKAGEVLSSEGTVPLTLRLQRIGTILIEARGLVVDSATSQPIPGAMIVLATNYHYAKPDTSYTGEDGRFRRMVQGGVSSSSVPRLICKTLAGNYKTDLRAIDLLTVLTEIDFGLIALPRSSVSLVPGRLRPHPSIPIVRIRFEANGRRIPLRASGNGLFHIPCTLLTNH